MGRIRRFEDEKYPDEHQDAKTPRARKSVVVLP